MQVASPTAVSADKRVLIFELLELIGVKIDTFLGISNKRTIAASNTRFVSFWRRILLVDIPDDIFSAILTALNIVRCFPFQNAFSDTVRFF
jgi:hypothetical protein